MRKFKHILLIDDDHASNYYHQYIFNQSELSENIYTVDNLDNLSLQLDHINQLNEEEIRPSIIFLDVNMPKYTGFEILEKYIHIFTDLSNKGAQMYVLTSSNNQRDKLKSKGYEMINGYLEKPLNDQFINVLKGIS